MIRLHHLVGIMLVALSFFLFFTTTQKSSRSTIVCTTSIIADAVEYIAGNRFAIKTLMGPGVDPHVYRPRESDVQALSCADLIFYNGLHLEGKMADMFEHMRSRIATVAVADALDEGELLDSEFEGLYDPHIWHDVRLWSKTIPSIAAAISLLDPENESIYHKRSQEYLDQLSRVDEYVRERVQRIPASHRELLTAHDAFHYFGRAYGFTVTGLQGISTDAVVSTHDIQQMVHQIVKNKIPAIFLESSIPSKSIESVQRAVASKGWHVAIAPELYSDSLGDKSTTASSYCGMIKHNVDVIVGCLT